MTSRPDRTSTSGHRPGTVAEPAVLTTAAVIRSGVRRPTGRSGRRRSARCSPGRRPRRPDIQEDFVRRTLLPRLAAVLALGLVLVGLPGVTRAGRAEAGTGQGGAVVAGLNLPNGTAVREENSYYIFQIINGGKLWFQSAEEFYAMGYTLPMVVVVPVGTLGAVPDVPGDGAMIRDRSDLAIYYVEGGVKHWVTDPDVLAAAGYTFADVTTIPNGSSALVARGADMTMADFAGHSYNGGPVEHAAGGGYQYLETDTIHTDSANGKARVTGGVKWHHGTFPKGYIHRGDIMSGTKAAAVAPVGCIWAQVKWGFPTGSLSFPPGAGLTGSEEVGEFFRSCTTGSQTMPDPIRLTALAHARAGLNSVTITVCNSARASDGPRNCGSEKNVYAGA
jgi:hypothetical protein